MNFGTSGWFILLRVQEASDRIAAECCLARPVHVPGAARIAEKKTWWKKPREVSQNQPKCEFYKPKIGIGCCFQFVQWDDVTETK